MSTEELITLLQNQIEDIIAKTKALEPINLQTLSWKKNSESWSILECLEHLNLYGAYYLPEIEKQIQGSSTVFYNEFHSSFLGRYFIKSIAPKENLNKMKTNQDKNPIHQPLDKTVIANFLEQQARLLQTLHDSRTVNWNQVKVKTSISKWIRLPLGDCYQFLIQHMLRHFEQIERIVKDHKSAMV